MMANSSFQISHSFINSLNDPILILNNNWKCITTNIAFERTFHLSAKEIRERHVKFLIPEIIIESYLKPSLEAYPENNNKSIEIPVKLKNQPQKIHHIILHPEFDKKGNIQTLFLIIKDIRLTENPYQLLQYITEYSDDLLYMMNNEQRFTYFSSSIEKILGY